MSTFLLICLGSTIFGTSFLLQVHSKISQWKLGQLTRMQHIQQLQQQRHDLVPAFIFAVRGAMRKEKAALMAVIESYNAIVDIYEHMEAHPDQIVSQADIKKQDDAEHLLCVALKAAQQRIWRYKALATRQDITQLFLRLSALEQEIKHAKAGYNASAVKFKYYMSKPLNRTLAKCINESDHVSLLNTPEGAWK